MKELEKGKIIVNYKRHIFLLVTLKTLSLKFKEYNVFEISIPSVCGFLI